MSLFRWVYFTVKGTVLCAIITHRSFKDKCGSVSKLLLLGRNKRLHCTFNHSLPRVVPFRLTLVRTTLHAEVKEM